MTNTPILDPARMQTPEQLSDKLSGIENLQLITAQSDPSMLASLPELTPDEDERIVFAARRMARIEKANLLAREDYARRMSERVYKPTADEFYYWLLEETRRPESPRYMGPDGFVIDEFNYHVFWALCLYFTGDSRFETLPGVYEQFNGLRFSLDKAIGLFGPVGAGKTQLMQLFADNPVQPYAFVRCRQIQSVYESTEDGMGGEASLRQFVGPGSVVSIWRERQGGWCFDDLGVEDTPAYHFKKAKNVMQWLFDERYAGRGFSGHSHFTTNLSSDQIEKTYGLRVRDRIRETTNILKFDPSAPSFRQP